MRTAKRIVVVGASAGGIEAIRTLLSGLPAPFPAAICIAIHTSPESPGVLAEIFGRETPLKVSAGRDLCRLEASRVYVAPPDRHLLIEPGRVRVTKGPREHGFRPAIDPLFRSAAQVFGPGAVGVILTGNLDDGTAGLWMIKKLGGMAVVQNPDDAMFPSMPERALSHVDVDYVVPLSRIPSLLVELTSDTPLGPDPVAVPDYVDVEVNIAKEQNPREAGLEEIGKPSPYSCPDCRGVLLEFEEGGRVRFRCHIGHAYSIDSLMAAMNQAIEHAMSVAVRSVEEGRLLLDEIASQLEYRKEHEAAARMREASNRARRKVAVMSELLHETDTVPTVSN